MMVSQNCLLFLYSMKDAESGDKGKQGFIKIHEVDVSDIFVIVLRLDIRHTGIYHLGLRFSFQDFICKFLFISTKNRKHSLQLRPSLIILSLLCLRPRHLHGRKFPVFIGLAIVTWPK